MLPLNTTRIRRDELTIRILGRDASGQPWGFASSRVAWDQLPGDSRAAILAGSFPVPGVDHYRDRPDDGR